MNNDIENITKFNEGYKLAELDNDLALQSIGTIDENSSEQLQFFREGVIEYEKEKLYEHLRSHDFNHEKYNDFEKE